MKKLLAVLTLLTVLAVSAHADGIVVNPKTSYVYLKATNITASVITGLVNIAGNGAGLTNVVYADAAVSNWSYFVVKSNVVMSGKNITGGLFAYFTNFYGMTGVIDSAWMTNLTAGAVTTLVVRATDVYTTNLYGGTGVVDSLSFTNMTGGTGTFTMVIGEGSGLTNMPFSFALSYGAMTTANDTNSILWSAPAPYTCTITNLNWYTRSPDVDVTGNLFLASSTKESTTWDYQCYTNMDFDGSTQKNASVSMVVSQGWSIGMMVSESTGSTVRIRGK